MRIISQSKIVQITSADTALALSRISKCVMLRDVQYLDQFTVQLRCQPRQYPYLHSVVQKLGGEVTVIKANPLICASHQILTRPVLTIFILLILVCSTYLPTRILCLQRER